MCKSFLLAVSLALCSASGALAQGWADSQGAAGNQTNSNTIQSANVFNKYNAVNPDGQGDWSSRGQTMRTNTNGAVQPGSGNNYGPHLFGATTGGGIGASITGLAQGSGAATGAPLRNAATTGIGGAVVGAITGQNMQMWAPSNLALQTQYGGNRSFMGFTVPNNPFSSKMFLPPTKLDSFVAGSGYDERIYGDEGVNQEPPYFFFTPDHYIERGIERMENNGALTTGHQSDAPSAWGYPQ